MLDRDSQDLNNVLLRVKQQMHDIDMFDIDSTITCNYAIPSVANTLNKIYLSTTLLNEFTSTYYNDKNDYLKYCFKNMKLVLLSKFITQP